MHLKLSMNFLFFCCSVLSKLIWNFINEEKSIRNNIEVSTIVSYNFIICSIIVKWGYNHQLSCSFFSKNFYRLKVVFLENSYLWKRTLHIFINTQIMKCSKVTSSAFWSKYFYLKVPDRKYSGHQCILNVLKTSNAII